MNSRPGVQSNDYMKKYVILSAILIAAGVSTASADTSFGVSFGNQHRPSYHPRASQGPVMQPRIIAPSHGTVYTRPNRYEMQERHPAPVVQERHYAPVVRPEQHYVAPWVEQHGNMSNRHY